MEDIQQREMRTMADAELAWARARDPMALVYGVMAAEALETPQPQWLTDALLTILYADCLENPRVRALVPDLPALWAKKRRRAQAAHIVAGVAAEHVYNGRPLRTPVDPRRKGPVPPGRVGAYKAAADVAAADGTIPRMAEGTAKQRYDEGLSALANPGALWQVPGQLVMSRLNAAFQRARESLVDPARRD